MAVVPRWYGGFFYVPMCDWIREMMAFWFPEPVEVDIDGDIVPDIPETVSGSDAYTKTLDKHVDIPKHLRRLPAVAEAERVIRSRR